MPFCKEEVVSSSKSGPQFGNIFILFKVKFPNEMDLEQVELLRQTLQHLDGMKPKAEKASDDIECYPLVRFDNSQRNTHP